jgi:glycosyltransferase involved in cell wall biosynthesis
MKIVLILSENIYSQDSARSNRYRTLIDGLASLGVDIQLIFTQGYGSIKEYKQFGWNGIINNIKYSYTIFLLHNSLWARRISGYVLSPLFKHLNAFLVRKKIQNLNPDIIWLLPTLEVLELYLAIGTHTISHSKLMIELNEFDDIALSFSTNKLQFELSKRYSHILLYKIIPKTDLLLVMTKNLLEYYRQFAAVERTKFLYLPMTVDLKRFDLKENQHEKYIAYCGSSSFTKDGVDIMIKAFSTILNIYPDIKLKIAAFMESDGVKMLALIKELNLQDKVIYMGELKREEIPEFITNASILLLPRPVSKQTQGGFPTKLGEYLATGNPVCATTVGEIPDYLKDAESVYFAVPGSIASFAGAMNRALCNYDEARLIGLNGKKVAEKYFNKEIQAKMLYNFIRENL